MIRRIAIALVIVGVIVGTLATVKYMQIRTLIAAGQAYAPPPETISTALVEPQRWQSVLSAIGSITTFQGVTVTVDLPGTVREIAFESGATVKAGDLLVRLTTSTEEAQLRAVEAQVALARVSLERAAALRKESMVSQAEMDAADATLKQTEAEAAVIRAAIEKKHIRAPFDGRLGIRLVNLGEYLDVGKPIVSLQSLSPVHCEFSLPQQEISRLQPGMTVRVTTDAYPDREFQGKLTAINPQLNASTRSLRLQATFENKDEALRPGMFARAEVLLGDEKPVLVVPATAILSAPYGDSVFVVESGTNAPGAEPTLVARQQFVRTGQSRGAYITVESGLEAGATVASSGLLKLRPGTTVVVNNELKPPSAVAPGLSDG